MSCNATGVILSTRTVGIRNDHENQRFDPDTPIEETVRYFVLMAVGLQVLTQSYLDAGSSRCRQGGICSVYWHEQLLCMAMHVPFFILCHISSLTRTSVYAMQSE